LSSGSSSIAISVPRRGSKPSGNRVVVALVRLAHHRWAIEQQYQELKDELGLAYFKGPSYSGWNRQALLTSLAYTWLQHERCRAVRG